MDYRRDLRDRRRASANLRPINFHFPAMKFQLLPSTFEADGRQSERQHLACFVIDDCVAVDAGSLAMGTSQCQKRQIRDVVLTHAHLDHIAGLPLFIDDSFAELKEPVRVHATREVIETLEKNVFNWEIYPGFSQLRNKNGTVLEYRKFEIEASFSIKHLKFKAIGVNHKVQTVGFLINDDASKIALTGDTAEMDRFWQIVNAEKSLAAVLIECAFPDELRDLALISHHLTPSLLALELKKFDNQNCPIYVINMKPAYREKTVRQIEDLKIKNLQILDVGKVYNWQ